MKCTQAISTRGAVLLVLFGVQITNNSVVKRKSLQICREKEQKLLVRFMIGYKKKCKVRCIGSNYIKNCPGNYFKNAIDIIQRQGL